MQHTLKRIALSSLFLHPFLLLCCNTAFFFMVSPSARTVTGFVPRMNSGLRHKMREKRKNYDKQSSHGLSTESRRDCLPASDNQDNVESPTEAHQQRLVLIGGGHAHVQVIKALHAASRPSSVSVTLIDATSSASYSGMVPGCIAGLYSPQATQLQLKPLAEWSSMTFVQDTVVDINLDSKEIMCRGGSQPIPYDVVSIDIGSTSRDISSVPGAREYAIPTRPIDKLLHRLEEARQEMLDVCSSGQANQVKLVVIGGGAAGIELSMAISSRWRNDGIAVECTILDAGDKLLSGENDRARATVTSLLKSKEVKVEHGCHVTSITNSDILYQRGRNDLNGTRASTRFPYTHCIWAAGAGAHSLADHTLRERGLDCDDYGYMKVNPTLQSTSHPSVFGAGDCATIVDLPNGMSSPPKAGVYAVRAGPILIENLTRYLEVLKKDQDTTLCSTEFSKKATSLVPYQPQDDFLKLLVCGDGSALGFRFGLALQGPWVFRLKDHIDSNFMKLFDVSNVPKPLSEPSQSEGNNTYDTRQYDDLASTELLPSLLEPGNAATLLLSTTDNVDIRQAQLVLRRMGLDDAFRDSVLESIDKR